MPCRLSPAQHRASLLAAQGKTNEQIARLLGLRRQTVKNYLSTAMHRLGARNRVELAIRLRRLQLEKKTAPAPVPIAADD